MTAEDWRQWLKSGMEIGSHTRNHANLNELSREQAIAEIKGSKDDLEARFACKVRHFCYPYGWFSERHKQLVQDAGYITATTTRRGKVTVPSDLFALKRIMVARATHLGLFAVKVLTGYEDRRT